MTAVIDSLSPMRFFHQIRNLPFLIIEERQEIPPIRVDSPAYMIPQSPNLSPPTPQNGWESRKYRAKIQTPVQKRTGDKEHGTIELQTCHNPPPRCARHPPERGDEPRAPFQGAPRSGGGCIESAISPIEHMSSRDQCAHWSWRSQRKDCHVASLLAMTEGGTVK